MNRAQKINPLSPRKSREELLITVRIFTACFVCLLAGLYSFAGCAGGIPSIPNEPDAIIKKGELYFQKGKYFQAQELFKGFLARHPGDEKSDYAQFMLAESYLKDGEYPLAAVEYRVVIGNYGYSEYVDDALFKEGICFFEQSPKSHLDQTKTFEALSRFKQFLTTFPSSPLVEDVKKYINKIHEKLAKKDVDNAMFYLRHKLNKAAKIYLDKVIENYPANDYWAKAMHLRGKIYLENGNKAEAIKMFEGVVNYPKELDFTNEVRMVLERLRNE